MDCFLFPCISKYSCKDSIMDATTRGAEESMSKSLQSSGSETVDIVGNATVDLKRQRAATLFLSFYMCGLKSILKDEEDSAKKLQYCFAGAQVKTERKKGRTIKNEKEELQRWHGRGLKRRRIGSREWISVGSNENFLCTTPKKLKRLMRKLSAKIKKMRRVQNAVSFHYDPLSYSMNFDDGCWQSSETHARLFSASSLKELPHQ